MVSAIASPELPSLLITRVRYSVVPTLAPMQLVLGHLFVCLLHELFFCGFGLFDKQNNFNFKAIAFNQSSWAGAARSDPVLHF